MTDNTYTRWAVTATDQELRTNLLTLDHRGRDAKEAALEELIARRGRSLQGIIQSCSNALSTCQGTLGGECTFNHILVNVARLHLEDLKRK